MRPFGLRPANTLTGMFCHSPSNAMKQTANLKTPCYQREMIQFPSSNELWTRSNKQLFLIFMRILLKYLELTHLEDIRHEVMESIAQCRRNYLQHRAHQKLCLTSMLHDHLCMVVPEPTWHRTEIYLEQYLLSRRLSRNGPGRGGSCQHAIADE